MTARTPWQWRSPVAIGVVVAIAVLALMPLGRMSELGILIAVIYCAWALVRRDAQPGTWQRDDAWRVLIVLALAYVAPALLSAIDAVDPSTSWRTALTAPRFAALAACLMMTLRDGDAARVRVAPWVALIVTIWTLDALVQALTGWSLAGHLDSDRVSGIFGDENLKIGPVLAVLSPFVLDQAWRRFGLKGLALVWVLIATAVLLAGARAAWIMYAVVTLGMAWRVTGSARRFASVIALVGVLGIAIGVVAYHASERFAARVDRTLALTQGTAHGLDYALAWRLPIFRTATEMALAHPINGVGVRGYRHAYPDYAAADDHWLRETGEGAFHPHQIVLEIAAETGAIGLLAWLSAVIVAWRAWRRQSPAARANAFAPALALFAMLFPLNTHFAFYSSFWGLMLWWLIGLWLAHWPRAETGS